LDFSVPVVSRSKAASSDESGLLPHCKFRLIVGESLKDTIINILLAVAILGGSYVIMHFFARAMYVRCLTCGTLNARRRSLCRNCAVELQK
jgi:hypothetical protein